MRTRTIAIIWLLASLLVCGIACLGQSEAGWQSRDSNYNIAISAGGGGSISLVVTGTNNFPSNTQITTSVDCPIGSLSVAFLSSNNVDTSPATVSDGHSNTYTKAIQSAATAALYTSAIYYSSNIANDIPSGSTVSESTSGGYFVAATVCIANANSGVDVTNSLAQASAVSSFSLTTGTLAQPTEIVLGGFTPSSGWATYTEATGFTPILTGSATIGMGVAYKIVSATTSVADNPSGASSSGTLTAVVASFKH